MVDKQAAGPPAAPGPLRFPLGQRPQRPLVTSRPYVPASRRPLARPPADGAAAATAASYQQHTLQPCEERGSAPALPRRAEPAAAAAAPLSPPSSPSAALERYTLQLRADLAAPLQAGAACNSALTAVAGPPAQQPSPHRAPQPPRAAPPAPVDPLAAPAKPAEGPKIVLQRALGGPSRAAGSGGGASGAARKQAMRLSPSAGAGLEAGAQQGGAPVKRKREEFERELLDRLLNTGSAAQPAPSARLCNSLLQL